MRISLAARVAEKSIPEPNTGCHLWTAGVFYNGYAQIRVAGKTRGAHRVVFELTRGPIPDGLWVLHRCDTPSCVNPDHLFLGTPLDNVRDKHAKARQRYPEAERRRSLTHCPKGHEYTPGNTRRTKHGRGCRECGRPYNRAAARRARRARAINN